MSRLAIVFWSGTGNTEAMANLVAEGARSAGAEVTLLTADGFTADMPDSFDQIAFGCPAMGAENLEDSVFEPMFASVEGKLRGKPVALFGSYGWGDGTWMRDWQARCEKAGAVLYGEGLAVNQAPAGPTEDACRDLGKGFAAR